MNLRKLATLAFKKARKLRVNVGGGGLTSSETTDLGVEGGTGGGPSYGEMDGSADGTGTDMVPAGMQTAVLGAIQVSPTHVIRSKCPRGYTLIKMPGLLTANVCVLTKVARALGLAHHRRGRGISARDLRAALRVTRLVRHMEKQLPHRVSHSYSHSTVPRKK